MKDIFFMTSAGNNRESLLKVHLPPLALINCIFRELSTTSEATPTNSAWNVQALRCEQSESRTQ